MVLASIFVIDSAWADEEKRAFINEQTGKFYKYCDDIERLKTAPISTLNRARIYSCDKPADVGVAIYAGKDLGDKPPESVGQWFERLYQAYDIDTKIFIENSDAPQTLLVFYASGTSLLTSPVNTADGVAKAKFLVAEAKLIFFVNLQIQATETEVAKWIAISDKEKATWQ